MLRAFLVPFVGAALAGVTGCLSTPPPAGGDDAPVQVDAAVPPDATPPQVPDPACPHQGRDLCAPGACIDEAAGGCVAEVCEALPSCCDTAWIPACVAIASTTCATCEHAAVIGAHQNLLVTERAGDWPVLASIGGKSEGYRASYRTIAVGDYDNDGDADLAAIGACDAGVFPTLSAAPGAVVLGVPTWIDLDDGVAGCPAFADSFRGAAVGWGDVDRDGDLDLAVGGMLGLGVIRQDESGWTLETLLSPADLVGEDVHDVGYLAWIDVDGDRWLDLVVGRGAGMRLFRNDGGVMRSGDAWEGPRFVLRGDACDLDGDLDMEIVVVDEFGDLRLFNAGGGFLAPAGQVDTRARAVACGDLDGDNLPELVSIDDIFISDPAVPGPIRIWRRGSAADPFVEVWVSEDAYRNEGAVALADDDGDADLDLLVTDPGEGPDYGGEWFHLLENTTVAGGAIAFTDHPGRYLVASPGYYSYGAAWLPLTSAR